MFFKSAVSSAPLARLSRLHGRLVNLGPWLWHMISNEIALRQARAALAALDDRMLKDIGVSRCDIEKIVLDVAGSRPRSRKER